MMIDEFLLARIAEDEAAAKAALSDYVSAYPASYTNREDDGRWTVDPSHPLNKARVEGIGITIYDEGGHTSEQAQHIARHDPARILAECEAKRRIVGLSWHHLGDDEYGWGMEEAKQQALALLALPYADHADYREEWRP